MDAVKLLQQDHEQVKMLFHDYEMAPVGQPERRRELAEEIVRELMVHERIEEDIFYPAFRKALGGPGLKEVEHAKEEHELVDSLIEQLQVISFDDPDFDATMKVLKENVEHHIEDEEEKMFPMAKARMANELLTLGADMVEYKQALVRELKDGVKAQPPRRGAQ